MWKLRRQRESVQVLQEKREGRAKRLTFLVEDRKKKENTEIEFPVRASPAKLAFQSEDTHHPQFIWPFESLYQDR